MQLFKFSKSYGLGLLYIFGAALIWAGASIFIQYIYEEMDFNSPFLVTYICSSLFVSYLPIFQIASSLGYVTYVPKFRRILSTEKAYSVVESDDSMENEKLRLNDCDECSSAVVHPPLLSYTHMDVIRMALIISPLWFIANCFYNYSLLMTSVSSSTIISNLSGTFTLAFSYWVGIEDITPGKILGILFCFGGAVVVALQDESDSGQQHLGGDIMALIAAIGYGIYTTVIRLRVPDDDRFSMQLLLGYIGLFNTILFAPVLVICIFSGLANISSFSWVAFGFVAVNGICDNVLSDYLWARAVVLTSPTVATVGMSITIPLAIVSDFLINGEVPSSIGVIGAILVIIGFTFVNLDKNAFRAIFCLSQQQ